MNDNPAGVSTSLGKEQHNAANYRNVVRLVNKL